MKSGRIALALLLASLSPAAHAQDPAVAGCKPFRVDLLLFNPDGAYRRDIADTLAWVRSKFALSPWMIEMALERPGPPYGPRNEKPAEIKLVPQIPAVDLDASATTLKVNEVKPNGSKATVLVSLEKPSGEVVAKAKGGAVAKGHYAGSVDVPGTFHTSGYLDIPPDTNVITGTLGTDSSYTLTSMTFNNGASVGLTVDQGTRLSATPYGFLYALGLGSGVAVSSGDTAFRVMMAPSLTNVPASRTFVTIVSGALTGTF